MKLTNLYGIPLTDSRQDRMEKVLNKKQPDLTVILENVNDPHNIAAVLRSCDAVGVMEVFVLNTRENTYRNFDERKSSSASKWMLVHQYNEIEACIKQVRSRYSRILSTYLSDDAPSLYSLNLTVSTALVFGNEHRGISESMNSFCDGNFIIPQVGMIESLNISVACAVTLYEAFRQKNEAGHYQNKRLNAEEEQGVLDFWKLKTAQPLIESNSLPETPDSNFHQDQLSTEIPE